MTDTATKTRNEDSKQTGSGQKTLLVGVDDGYAQTKIYGEGPDGKPVQRVIRSSARPGREGLSDLSDDNAVSAYTVEEGEDFTVSDKLEAEDTKFDGFHVSRLDRVLVQHALIHAGYSNQKVNIFTGVPVSDYFIDGDRDDEKIKQKAENLKKGVSPADGTPAASIQNVQVGCQAVAAFFDFVMGNDMKPRDGVDTESDVVIVDIGGRTTDIATVVNGKQIDQKRSGTKELGVLNVYDDVAMQLRREFGIKRGYTPQLLDRAVRDRKVKVWGKQEDISHLVNETVQGYEAQLAREVERRLGDTAAHVGHIVFVGGGANLFTGISEHFPNGAIVEAPEMANARGLYKLLKL